MVAVAVADAARDLTTDLTNVLVAVAPTDRDFDIDRTKVATVVPEAAINFPTLVAPKLADAVDAALRLWLVVLPVGASFRFGRTIVGRVYDLPSLAIRTHPLWLR
jgi:hypothetical protein